VDDQAEREFLNGLETQAGDASVGNLYPLFIKAPSAPVSLQEEFELFRVMYYALRTYGMNTTLEHDPQVHGKREAVRRTMAIIARTLAEEPPDIQLSIENYGEYIR